MMTYSIGQVARMLELSTQSIRNWERQELIPKPSRSLTNRRKYTEDDIEAIREYLEEKYNK